MGWDGTPIPADPVLSTTNSYVTTLAEAQAYFDTRLFTDGWDQTADADKAKALIMATRQIDTLLLQGRKNAEDQALAFPRSYQTPVPVVVGTRWVQVSGWWVEEEVPDAVKAACCEQALFLVGLTAYDRARQKGHAMGVIGGSLGPANEYSAQAFVAQNRKKPVLCPDAKALMGHYIAGAVKIGG